MMICILSHIVDGKLIGWRDTRPLSAKQKPPLNARKLAVYGLTWTYVVGFSEVVSELLSGDDFEF